MIAPGSLEVNDGQSLFRGHFLAANGVFSGRFGSDVVDVVDRINIRDGAVASYHGGLFEQDVQLESGTWMEVIRVVGGQRVQETVFQNDRVHRLSAVFPPRTGPASLGFRTVVFACEGVGARDQLQFEFYRNGERYYADLWDGALGHSRVFASPGGVNVGYYWMFESAVIDLGELGPSTAPESWEVWVSAWREVEDAANTLVEYRTTGLVRLSLDGVHLSVSGEHPWTSVLAAGSGGGYIHTPPGYGFFTMWKR